MMQVSLQLHYRASVVASLYIIHIIWE